MKILLSCYVQGLFLHRIDHLGEDNLCGSLFLEKTDSSSFSAHLNG